MPKREQQRKNVTLLTTVFTKIAAKDRGRGTVPDEYRMLVNDYAASYPGDLTNICKFYKRYEATNSQWWAKMPALMPDLRQALYTIFYIKTPPLSQIRYPEGTIEYSRDLHYAKIKQQRQMETNLMTCIECYIKGVYEPTASASTVSVETGKPSLEIELLSVPSWPAF